MHRTGCAALALLLTACGGTRQRDQGPSPPAPPGPPPFEVSPSVFGTLEPNAEQLELTSLSTPSW